METISAASLVNAMLEAHPEHAGALGRFAEALASGSMGMQAFAAAVRQELGKEVLLEALVRLRGGKKPTVQHHDVASLAAHAQTCRGSCGNPGCLQIHEMLHTIRKHCLECAAPKECSTCMRWAHRLKDLPATPPVLAARPAAASSASQKKDATTHGECGNVLMLLARSALGDITDSPGASRCNSPTTSPARLPSKRQKMTAPPTEAVSLLSKAVRCAPTSTSERDVERPRARPATTSAVQATTVGEASALPTPAPLRRAQAW